MRKSECGMRKKSKRHRAVSDMNAEVGMRNSEKKKIRFAVFCEKFNIE